MLYNLGMKILITGAHFTPAVATIEEFKKYKGIKIIYVGRKHTFEDEKSLSVESQVLPTMGLKFIPLTTGRLQKEFTIYTIFSLLKIPIGFIQSLYIILYETPDVILSFGGYVAVPVVFAGWLFSIPIIIHEQTLVSGLANKISSIFADKIAVSFKNTFNKNKTILTGNPTRTDILKISNNFSYVRENVMPIILITGGNQGSHILNLVVAACLDELTKIASIIHVTGDNRFKDFERLDELRKFGDKYVVKKWIDKEWGAILSRADLVVSRAGINTLTELAYIGKPAIVIPIPYLFQDEQNKNAKYFEEHGLVRILPQSNLSGKTLIENIKWMLKNLDSLKQKAKDAKKIIIPDAGKRLALETVLLAEQKK